MNVHEELTLAPCPYCQGMHQAGTSEQCALNPNRGEQSKTVTNGYATLEWHTQCAALLEMLYQHRDEMREAAHAL